MHARPSTASVVAHWMKPFLAATISAVMPSLLAWSTFRPRRRKQRMSISMPTSLPLSALSSNAVLPAMNHRYIIILLFLYILCMFIHMCPCMCVCVYCLMSILYLICDDVIVIFIIIVMIVNDGIIIILNHYISFISLSPLFSFL